MVSDYARILTIAQDSKEGFGEIVNTAATG
jgi:hypothetical protein